MMSSRVLTVAASALHALLVSVALTVCDAAGHVAYGALVYASPDAGSVYPGQPTGQVWLGFLGIGVFVTVTGSVLQSDAPRPSLGATALGVLAFLAAYIGSGPFGGWPMTLHAVFLATWWIHLQTFPTSAQPRLVAWSVLLGLLGPVFEGAYAHTGFFHYVDADAFGVPMWLMGIYLHGALAVARTVRLVAA
ncbi:MAG: hypothetical protein RLZZ383_2357 [Pseudomonadota bacterium]|jgi:hypothetical protein